jgi:muconolactone delta-isomerase
MLFGTPEALAAAFADAFQRRDQARAAELFAAGSLEQLYVAADFAQAWLIARTESLMEAKAAIESLPLARFFQSAYTPLADLS